MRIKRLELTRFGKFREEAVTFEQGLDVISAPNEYGKTTLTDAIRFCLYGFEKKRTRGETPPEESDLVKYQPWGSHEGIAAAMIVETEGGTQYRIERQTDEKGRGSVGMFRAGEKMAVAETPGEFLLGMDAATFRNVYCMRPSGDAPGRTDRMEIAMQNLAATGSEDVSFEAVMAALVQERSQYTSMHRNTGKLPEANRKKAAAEDEAARLGIRLREMDVRTGAELDAETAAAEREIAEMTTVLDGHKAYDAYRRRQRRAALQAEMQEIEEELKKLPATDETALGEAAAQLSQIERAEARLEQAQEIANGEREEPPQRPEDIPAPSQSGRIAGFVMIAAAAVSGAAAIVTRWYLLFIAAAALIAAGTAIILSGAKKRAAYQREYAAAETTLRTYKQRAEAREEEAQAAREEWQRVCRDAAPVLARAGVKDRAELDAAYRALREISTLTSRRAACAARLEDLPDAAEDGAAVTVPPEIGREQAEARLEAARRKKNALMQEKAETGALRERRDATLRLRREQEDNIADLKREIERMAAAQAAADLAIEALKEAQKQMQQDYAPILQKAISRRMAMLTGGKYDNVSVDRDMHIRILADGALQPLGYFSSGTVAAAHLALRLSLAEILENEKKEPAPFLIDDAFQALDDDRARAARECLEAAGGERQILFFTCKNI